MSKKPIIVAIVPVSLPVCVPCSPRPDFWAVAYPYTYKTLDEQGWGGVLVFKTREDAVEFAASRPNAVIFRLLGKTP